MIKALSRYANRFLDCLLEGTAWASGLLILFLIISVSTEVVLRYFFGRPTTWVTEFGAYVMLWCPFLVAAYVLRENKHVTMDLVLLSLKPQPQFVLNLITTILGMVVSAIVTFFGVRVVIELCLSGERTETYLALLKWPIMGIIPFSTFLLTVEFLRKLLRLLQQRKLDREPLFWESKDP